MKLPAALALAALTLLAAGATRASGLLRIAFVSNRASSHTDLYVMNADGTGVTQLTTNPKDDALPRSIR